jgi:hypothetical protein
MATKTFKVQALLDMVNNSLATYQTEHRSEISGMVSVLEQVLHQTGNYNGFRYLEQPEVPFGCIPGIRFDLEDKFYNTDGFRRYYY